MNIILNPFRYAGMSNSLARVASDSERVERYDVGLDRKDFWSDDVRWRGRIEVKRRLFLLLFVSWGV